MVRKYYSFPHPCISESYEYSSIDYSGHNYAANFISNVPRSSEFWKERKQISRKFFIPFNWISGMLNFRDFFKGSHDINNRNKSLIKAWIIHI